MSNTMRITLPTGSVIELPPQNGPSQVPLGDFPGIGARPEDTLCIRCGMEACIAHRKNISGCNRECFLCKTKAHPGKVCPTMAMAVDRHWWRQRGFQGPLPGALEPHFPDIPGAVRKLGDASSQMLFALSDLFTNAPDSSLSTYVLDNSAELASVAAIISQSVAPMQQIPASQFQATVREAMGGTVVQTQVARSQDASMGAPIAYSGPPQALAPVSARKRSMEKQPAKTLGELAALNYQSAGNVISPDAALRIKEQTQDEAPEFWEAPKFYFSFAGAIVMSTLHGSSYLSPSVGVKWDDPSAQIHYESMDIEPFRVRHERSGALLIKTEEGGIQKSSRCPSSAFDQSYRYPAHVLAQYHNRPLLSADEKKRDDNEKPADPIQMAIEEKRRLYISNISCETTEENLMALFKFFMVESITIPKDPRTLCPVGHAFVSLSTPASAERAIADLTGRMLLGRKVSIELAHFKNFSDAAVPMTAASRESAIDELIREESEKVHIAVSNGVVSKNASVAVKSGIDAQECQTSSSGDAPFPRKRKHHLVVSLHSPSSVRQPIPPFGAPPPGTDLYESQEWGAPLDLFPTSLGSSRGSRDPWGTSKRPKIEGNGDPGYGRLTPPPRKFGEDMDEAEIQEENKNGNRPHKETVVEKVKLVGVMMVGETGAAEAEQGTEAIAPDKQIIGSPTKHAFLVGVLKETNKLVKHHKDTSIENCGGASVGGDKSSDRLTTGKYQGALSVVNPTATMTEQTVSTVSDNVEVLSEQNEEHWTNPEATDADFHMDDMPIESNQEETTDRRISMAAKCGVSVRF